MLQEALDRWWPPLMQMHGPRSPREQDRDLFWRIKAKTSEELRQEFLGIYVPTDPRARPDAPGPGAASGRGAGEWRYTEPDWDELRAVVTGHGPASAERVAFRQASWDEQAWVRRRDRRRPAGGGVRPR